MDHKTLIGKIFRFEYSDETYRIEVLTDVELRWTREQGNNIGESDVERYQFSQISEAIDIITWIEESGLGLSNVMNYRNNSVTTHANTDRDVFENQGKLVF